MSERKDIKLCIIGSMRMGKDTMAEILRDEYGMTFESSSQSASDIFLYDLLKEKYGYETSEECFEDRHNHRQEWYEMISAYCGSDLARLGREIFQKFDIYCGLRNKREWSSMKNEHVYDYAIWVDRSDYLPPEDETSNSMQPWMADFYLDNNGTLEDLEYNVNY